jgi:hypothetical protein
MTPDHVVSDRLIEFHRRVAAGGVGMTTIAYCAGSEDGQGAPNEMILTEAALPGLRTVPGSHARWPERCARRWASASPCSRSSTWTTAFPVGCGSTRAWR